MVGTIQCVAFPDWLPSLSEYLSLSCFSMGLTGHLSSPSLFLVSGCCASQQASVTYSDFLPVLLPVAAVSPWRPRFPSGSPQGRWLLSGLDGSLQSTPRPMTDVTAGVGEQEGGSHFVWTLGSSRCSDSFTPPGPCEGAVPLSILQMRKQEVGEMTPAGRKARSRLDVCSQRSSV